MKLTNYLLKLFMYKNNHNKNHVEIYFVCSI